MKTLNTRRGPLDLPTFLPDGTRAAVRGLGSDDLHTAGLKALMVNSLHLSHRPGTSVLQQLGGIHSFMNWDGVVMSDSGGFQVLSLLKNDPSGGSISQHGFTWRTERGGEKRKLTPEACIRHQLQLGADILFCLDWCTHPDDPRERQEESVTVTIAWARRCREEFDRLVAQKKWSDKERPLLYAVIQGGDDEGLRRRCAEELLAIGFDGYGFGGWPIRDSGELVETVQLVADLVPDEFPLHGLGIGSPENIVAARKSGYDTFDCVLPTRDARHLRLYTYTTAPETGSLPANGFYKKLYLQDDKWHRHGGPADETCDCPLCRDYSLAYLYHLFRVEEPLAIRLASIHNLRFYTRLLTGMNGTCNGC